jgi:glycosyltransferase involved in cell wall biosynthesis
MISRADNRLSLLRSRFDLIFVLPHMGRGGAQHVVSLVANAWSRQGKRICILTWDGNREEAHDIAAGVARVDLTDLCREIEFRWGPLRWLRWRTVDRMRKVERWLRPRWPWRKNIKSSSTVDGDAPSGGEEGERITLEKSRSRRRAMAAILTALERSSPRIALPWYRNYSKKVVMLSLLGRRVEKFRVALAALKAPVVVSLLTSTNLYVLAAAPKHCRVVVSERNDPDLQRIDSEWSALRRVLYRQADVVTSNSAGILAKFATFVPAEKLKLLPNPVMVRNIEDGRQRERRFVAVARLVHQKGVDLLLAAFAQIADEIPGWSLHIVGDGPLRSSLIADAEQLGIADRVTFHGHVKDPIDVLQTSRIFVLPSRFEGMPNAMLEAMACGLAPIVTDASPGPLECVKSEETGLVVKSEDVPAIAAAMLRLARNDNQTALLARQAMAYVKEHDWAVVERQWLAVLGMADDAKSVSRQGAAASHG